MIEAGVRFARPESDPHRSSPDSFHGNVATPRRDNGVRPIAEVKLLPNRSVVPSPTRLALILIASITGLVAIWPVLTLVREALTSLHSGFSDLGPDGMRQIVGTIQLLLGTATLGTLLGTANGWLLCNCRFPGRAWLRIAPRDREVTGDAFCWILCASAQFDSSAGPWPRPVVLSPGRSGCIGPMGPGGPRSLR